MIKKINLQNFMIGIWITPLHWLWGFDFQYLVGAWIIDVGPIHIQIGNPFDKDF